MQEHRLRILSPVDSKDSGEVGEGGWLEVYSFRAAGIFVASLVELLKLPQPTPQQQFPKLVERRGSG